jgi:hypothetical protein
VPVHCLGLAQQRLAFVYGLGPGAPVGVLSAGTLVPHTYARAVVAEPAARLAEGVIEDQCKVVKESFRLRIKGQGLMRFGD